MSIVCLDFESFYSAGFTLSTLSTEEYIRDPRFETIGCGISMNGRPSVWYPQPEVKAALDAIDWSTNSLLAFNTAFDGAILAWIYGHYPALYLDAMGLAKARGKTYNGASLAKVAETMGVGEKGTYVVSAKGKRYVDFTAQELYEYGVYCKQDVDLTVQIYRQLSPGFPLSETLIQDLNLRLFIEPVLDFDTDVLHLHLEDVKKQKQDKLQHAMQQVGVGTEEELTKALMSNPQFATVLRSLGVEPPTKLSPATGLSTFAFAKTDPDFVALLEHEDSAVQAVTAARLGVRSTIEEARAQRFIDIAGRGPWPVQYNYFGGDTSRFSGAGNANPQNLKRGGKLRDSICPPPGHAILAADLRQIECRVLNYWAGEENIVEAFRLHDAGQGPDVYCLFAEKIYRKPVTGDTPKERTVGKIGELSLGYGAGWKAFKSMLFVQAKGMVISEGESRGAVDIYRDSHQAVVKLWRQGDRALAAMLRGVGFDLGKEGMVIGTADGILMPNGLKLRYPELKQQADKETGEVSFVYTKRGKPVVIHGAVVVQNCVEYLSRLILTDAWLRLSKRVRVVMHQHDELSCVVPYDDVEWALDLMAKEMTWPVPWAPGLPLSCEVKSGSTYGEARR